MEQSEVPSNPTSLGNYSKQLIPFTSILWSTFQGDLEPPILLGQKVGFVTQNRAESVEIAALALDSRPHIPGQDVGSLYCCPDVLPLSLSHLAHCLSPLLPLVHCLSGNHCSESENVHQMKHLAVGCPPAFSPLKEPTSGAQDKELKSQGTSGSLGKTYKVQGVSAGSPLTWLGKFFR